MQPFFNPVRAALLSALLATATTPILAQDNPPPTQPPIGGGTRPPGFPGMGGQRPPAGPKPYATVVTKEAKTEKGVFWVHKIDEKYLFEIPTDALGREMLWSTEIAKLPAGAGYPGTAAGEKVVRWTRRGNKVYLHVVNHSIRATEPGAIQTAVAAATLEPIVMSFDVEAEGEGKTAVIDVTRLVSSDVPEFSARQRLNGGGVDPSRSYVESIKPFAQNIEIRQMLTFTGGAPPQLPAGLPPGLLGRRSSAPSITALIHHSLVMLPEKPMMGRYFDSRVGYFTNNFDDYGTKENRVVPKEFINRFRLEKKDPSAVISEPVKPITFYLAREVPDHWRPYIKKGIEEWQVAFEAAGFKNAIIAKDAPTKEEDPHWDPEDVRYSVIRWAPQPIANAMGPSVQDPRSGETISAHIIMWHNILKLNEEWYFSQVAPLDPRAKTLPLPESLMGELVRYVVSHEVGHTLGLRHNHKASSSYTVKQLRDKAFTEKYGDEASIMDYGRFNYVAQPGDNAYLMPKIGPYDLFAIEWGYKPLPDAKTPDDEKKDLDTLAAKQVTDIRLRFGGESASAQVDPTVQTEDLGSDPVEATEMGLKNIDRVMKMLIPATSKFGEDYERLREMYDAVIGQRQRELNHVVKLVGGVVETDYHAGRGGAVFNNVPKAKQKEAVLFLNKHAFQTPKSLIIPDILKRIEPSGVADRILGTQRGLLASLMREDRVKRMLDNEAINGTSAYSVSEMMSDVTGGVWSELSDAAPKTDLYRRNLQRAYIASFKPILTGETTSSTDLRPIATGTLRELAKKLDKAIAKAGDKVSALHFADSRKQIERILEPKQ